MRYEFDASKVNNFPLVSGSILDLARQLDRTVRDVDVQLPARLLEQNILSTGAMVEAKRRVTELRAKIVWLQEELDWRCMYLYAVTGDDYSFSPDQVFELTKGQRAFEIYLARRIAAGEIKSTWFDRHASTPITTLPSDWPDWYRERVEERLALIESDPLVNLLERPEYKRRWKWNSWEELASEGLQRWLIRRLENARYWSSSQPRSVAQLADTAQHDNDFVVAAMLYLDTPEIDLVKLISELTRDNSVPFLAAMALQ